jgi:GNAT superfamily N-acetyltransferase
MPNKEFTLITTNDRADYRELIAPVAEAVWPEFMLHDAVADQYWGELFTRFPAYQFALLETDAQQLVGLGNSVPLAWRGEPADLPDEGWDWALAQSVADHQAGRAPRTQCAIQIAIAPAYQGRGISAQMVQAMRSIGAVQGLPLLVAPVRPSFKSRYPLTPIERYVRWKNAEGLPFDPWLRVHARLGAELVKVCHRAMRVTGRVSEWEAWTGMTFPESGAYVVPGALVPVEFDHAADQGTYIEPNVWMVHQIEPT